eukprot:Pompholyxophrys_punicea_v1_NODE_588_length_1634_cov_14.206460.p2 type:complete len:101 gc:universal NODE_588_length_1634_cov_14.206460:348-46(-)
MAEDHLAENTFAEHLQLEAFGPIHGQHHLEFAISKQQDKVQCNCYQVMCSEGQIVSHHNPHSWNLHLIHLASFLRVHYSNPLQRVIGGLDKYVRKHLKSR